MLEEDPEREMGSSVVTHDGQPSPSTSPGHLLDPGASPSLAAAPPPSPADTAAAASRPAQQRRRAGSVPCRRPRQRDRDRARQLSVRRPAPPDRRLSELCVPRIVVDADLESTDSRRRLQSSDVEVRPSPVTSVKTTTRPHMVSISWS